MDSKVIQSKFGYYQLKNKPGEKELAEYYANKYYQEGMGPYAAEYSAPEIQYFMNEQRYFEACLKKLTECELDSKSFLDIGCGEGWSLSHFKNIGCHVKGVDFSSFGIQKFNPGVIDYFVKSDIYEFLEKENKSSNKYDIINVIHIVEHVLEPEELLRDLKSILSPDGVIVVKFPNDFSEIQKLSVKLGKNNEFWIAEPDHISYFSKDSFTKIAESLGLNVSLFLGEFPIDIFLLNDHSNYVKNKRKGKQAHLSRIHTMNLLNEMDFESALQAFIKFGQMGFGRALTAFMKVNT